MENIIKVGVLGAGTWGVALARMLNNAGKSTTVWSAIEKEIDELQSTGRHPNLPGVELPSTIAYTKNIKEACDGMDVVLFAVPSPFVRATARRAAPYITDGQIIVDRFCDHIGCVACKAASDGGRYISACNAE